MHVFFSIICIETFLKACGSLKSGAAPTPTKAKMNYAANQLIFKITNVQKLSIFVLKFKHFLQKIFKHFEKSGAILG